jgi:hypothetical protein
MTHVTIVGAGMAGLLAANMLHKKKATVIEGQSSLPNNHSAVLRFRSDKVAEVLGIPFKKVNMMKDTLRWANPIVDSLLYSKKAGGVARSDRSIVSEVVSDTRWIAPPDLIAQMAKDINIIYNYSFDPSVADPRIERDYHMKGHPIISTVPMPVLMEILDYKPAHGRPEFKSISGINVSVKLRDVDAYVSLYIPDPSIQFNRLSITGDELIIEFAFPVNMPKTKEAFTSVLDHVENACEILGGLSYFSDSIKVNQQRYAKVLPIDERERKTFLAWATDKHSIFSLGRFATWRPGLLLDDLIHDVRLIEKWIGDNYAMRAAR